MFAKSIRIIVVPFAVIIITFMHRVPSLFLLSFASFSFVCCLRYLFTRRKRHHEHTPRDSSKSNCQRRLHRLLFRCFPRALRIKAPRNMCHEICSIANGIFQRQTSTGEITSPVAKVPTPECSCTVFFVFSHLNYCIIIALHSPFVCVVHGPCCAIHSFNGCGCAVFNRKLPYRWIGSP